jgi:hypothetical protein
MHMTLDHKNDNDKLHKLKMDENFIAWNWWYG